MIYILVALEAEFDSSLLDKGKYEVVYTGVGKVNAAFAATKYASRSHCKAVINYGTAGALNQDLIGKLLEVGTLYQRDMDARPLTPLGETPYDKRDAGAIQICNSPYTISTGDNFVTDTPEIETDLVDMESYAIAKVCNKLAVPFYCVKYASDFADENAAEHWQDNVDKGVTAFKEWLKIYELDRNR
jgi:adenosylhomocysteine nucleosidase